MGRLCTLGLALQYTVSCVFSVVLFWREIAPRDGVSEWQNDVCRSAGGCLWGIEQSEDG